MECVIVGDVILVQDSITVERRVRDDGKKKHYELCIIYPDYMNHDNDIVEYKTEEKQSNIFVRVISRTMSACFDES